MEINQYFYLFSFKPQLLSEERVKIEQKYKNKAADIIKKRGKMLLPKLLEIIRSTPSESIAELAQGLKKMEVLMLIYEDYPFPEESVETVQKINQILTARYCIEVGKTAWVLFQHQYEQSLLQDLLKRIYTVDQFGFLLLEDELLLGMEEAVLHKEGMAQGLLSLLLKTNLKTKDAFHLLKIEEESKLEAALMKGILSNGLAADRIINRDGTEFIVRLLDNYPMDEYKSLIKIYLEPRKYNQFHAKIIQQAVERLRDPRERSADWEFLSEASVGEVKRWLIQKKLQIIFENDQDNQRLNYWKRFIDYMEDVELIQDPMIAFIYFDKFVVVEYGSIGAAYFYHRDGFDQIIHPISTSSSFSNSRNSAKKESMLKVPESTKGGILLFIDKLDHRGGRWNDKFDNYMRYYLDGVFY
ncbi:EH signature domain-containing protein [Paenibacillus sp. JX-17]|uniref:EH signature domain-containing protein n=1 Tax=Paenibacillus lacisoli TaxID=3064525 RepID=A0ABT9CIY6_9BACL|nr:EH signature domain-containing protein [Paenibacillus sp. JX-17]MDO7907573.1 EH signature domain-containing protein [Paenibacillus sp. JX-17]